MKKTPLFSILPRYKRYAIPVVGFLIGALMMIAGGNSNTESQHTTPPIAETDAVQIFLNDTESRLCELISSIDGAGEVRVMITLESGYEYIYAQTEKTEDDSVEGAGRKYSSESSVTVIEGGNGDEALTVKRMEPSIRGVAVVCEGGGITTVKAEIIETVSTVLGISSNRVSVSKMYG